MPFIRKDALEALILAGQKMSNVCFNLKQVSNNKLEDHMKTTMDECQREWDATLRIVRHPELQS